MPILQIKPNFLPEESLKGFKWEEWRAERIIRELRGDGEYLFASCRKNYGVIENTHELDLGNKKEDYLWIGRIEDRVGERGPDVNPKSPTFGTRVYREPEKQLSEEWNEATQKWEEIETKKGRLVHKYICEATPENLQKFKSMVGKLDNGRVTNTSFIFGSAKVDMPDPDVFFKEGKVVAKFEKSYYETLGQNKDQTMAQAIAEAILTLQKQPLPEVPQEKRKFKTA